MSSWKVDNGSYDPASYLAIDQILGEESRLPVLRPDVLDRPALLSSRRTPQEAVSRFREDEDLGYSRRPTRNAPIFIGENGVSYSIIVDSPPGERAPTTFENRIAPKLIQVLEPFESDLKADDVNSAIRTGREPTPEGHPPGRTLSGNALYDLGDAVICQGMINIGSWNELDDWRKMQMDEDVERVVEDLPYVDAGRYQIVDSLIESFTGGNYGRLNLNDLSSEKEDLVENKYNDGYWPDGPEDYDQTGHCMVDRKDGMVF